MNSHARYNATAISLHWLIALGVTAAAGLGLYMHELPLSPHKLRLYSYHKWIGISILALMGLRLVWRMRHAPPPPAPMPPWQQAMAQAVHKLLYLLLLLVPLSGWLMSSALGFQVVWFGVLPLPDLVGKDRLLGEMLVELHRNFNWMLLTLVTLHVVAALKHQFVDHDGLLQRMLPALSRK